MNVLKYSALTMFFPTFAYCIYWLSFRKDHTSPVPWILIGLLGIFLCESVIYLVVVQSSKIKKIGLAGQEQTPVDH